MATYEIDSIKVANANGTLVEYDIVPDTNAGLILGTCACNGYNYKIGRTIYNHHICLLTNSGRYVTLSLFKCNRTTKYTNLSSVLTDIISSYGLNSYIPCSGNIYVSSSIGSAPIDYAYIHEEDDGEYSTIILDLYYHNGLTSTSITYVSISYCQDGSYSGDFISDGVRKED